MLRQPDLRRAAASRATQASRSTTARRGGARGAALVHGGEPAALSAYTAPGASRATCVYRRSAGRSRRTGAGEDRIVVGSR